MSHRSLLTALVLALFVLAHVSTPATAALIDFEVTPLGVAANDDDPLPLGLPYTNTPGVAVSFGFDTDSNGSVDTDARFEHVGLNVGEPPNGGFAGSHGTDTADPGFGPQLGTWFLRGPVGGAPFGTFVITYSSTFAVTACSGEIWDIDGTDDAPGGNAGFTEQYRVRAFDAGNNLLASVDSPLGVYVTPIAPLDGRPWVFSFSGLTAGISRVEITFLGTKPDGIGLAFNNFDPIAPVPEPSAIAIFGVALAGLAARRSARTRHSQ